MPRDQLLVGNTLVGRFPERARTIRRLQTEDATFRAICEDHAEAERALAYWRAAEQAKAEEYRRLVEELEKEALEALEAYERG